MLSLMRMDVNKHKSQRAGDRISRFSLTRASSQAKELTSPNLSFLSFKSDIIIDTLPCPEGWDEIQGGSVYKHAWSSVSTTQISLGKRNNTRARCDADQQP